MYSKENTWCDECEDNLKWQTQNFASSRLSMATAKKFIQIAADKRNRLFFDLKVHLEKKLRMAELGFNIQNTNTTKGSFWSIRKNLESEREGEREGKKERERGRERGQERMWERGREKERGLRQLLIYLCCSLNIQSSNLDQTYVSKLKSLRSGSHTKSCSF